MSYCQRTARFRTLVLGWARDLGGMGRISLTSVSATGQILLDEAGLLEAQGSV